MSDVHHAISDTDLDTLFRSARTQNKWQDKPVSNAMLMAIYDLLRWTRFFAAPAHCVTGRTSRSRMRC